MAELIAISVSRKDYRSGRSMARGRSVPLMMETAMKGSLGAVLADVKRQLPGKRLKVNTRMLYNQTPKGATARLIVGEGVPFANVQAKYGKSPTVIKPKNGKYLAIPMNAFAKGLQNKVKSLREYGSLLHPRWRGKGERGNTLFYGKGNTPAFNLVKQVTVKPSVDLNEVNSNMRSTIVAAFKEAFAGYDFGFVSMRKG